MIGANILHQKRMQAHEFDLDRAAGRRAINAMEREYVDPKPHKTLFHFGVRWWRTEDEVRAYREGTSGREINPYLAGCAQAEAFDTGQHDRDEQLKR